MEQLMWKKDIFSSKLEIKQGTERIGKVDPGANRNSGARAIFNGRFFQLNRDFILARTNIFDSTGQTPLASLTLSLFETQNDVIINGKRFELEIKNIWQSEWVWKYNGQEIISYHSLSPFLNRKGSIELNTACTEEVEILVLLGLFARNQSIPIFLLIALIVAFSLL